MKKVRILIVIVIIISIIFFIMCKFRTPILQKIYVTQYEEYVDKYSKKYNVDKYLVYSIIKAESNFKKEATSNKGAKGLMQLMDTTAYDVARSIDLDINESDIWSPEININLGVKYIASLIDKYKNIELALVAYNAGIGKVDSWIEKGTLKKDGSNVENVPYMETNNYVRKILRDFDIYKQLYNSEK